MFKICDSHCLHCRTAIRSCVGDCTESGKVDRLSAPQLFQGAHTKSRRLHNLLEMELHHMIVSRVSLEKVSQKRINKRFENILFVILIKVRRAIKNSHIVLDP